MHHLVSIKIEQYSSIFYNTLLQTSYFTGTPAVELLSLYPRWSSLNEKKFTNNLQFYRHVCLASALTGQLRAS